MNKSIMVYLVFPHCDEHIEPMMAFFFSARNGKVVANRRRLNFHGHQLGCLREESAYPPKKN